MNDKMIEDLIAQLDESFSKGTGHVNVIVAEDGIQVEHTQISDEYTELIKEVKTLKSSECNSLNMACSVPTLFEGLDDKEEG